jgi:hypothetical protein
MHFYILINLANVGRINCRGSRGMAFWGVIKLPRVRRPHPIGKNVREADPHGPTASKCPNWKIMKIFTGTPAGPK